MDFSWRPHSGPQTDFCSRGEREALYGGAAGPGKTDCLIALALRNVWHPKYRGLILRRTFPRLVEILDRARQLYPKSGGHPSDGGRVWTFPSGSKIRFGHMEHVKDRYNYQGIQYQYFGFDELTEFEEIQYLYLFSRARRTLDLPFPTIFRAASNPGNIGHGWVKNRFRIGLVPPGSTIHEKFVHPETGEEIHTSRVFIPGRLSDNPSINAAEYVANLMHLPEIDRMRLLDGIWDVFEGQAFRELNADVHGIKPFEIPLEWECFRSFDWGYAKPFSVQWYACDFDGRLYRFAHWYGCGKDEKGNWKSDTGVKMTATEIARGIRERERDMRLKIRPGPADPSIYSRRPAKDGTLGISVADEMSQEGVLWLKADNDRILGRQQVHHRLALDDEGKPSLYVFADDEHFWRTMPLLQEYDKNPEDIAEKNVEDHDYDALRYALMFKPIRPRARVAPDLDSFQHERRKMIAARQHAARYGIPLANAYNRAR